ncbi:polysaccharide deacetylase family protein, partial [Tepidanaerobacter syntrophicus]|uniref:polysaccharide deacetylase family protein n=1 Tax=Tepidanaerobacter syntrophicus TaxID=224999 RepID=UPI001BD1C593
TERFFQEIILKNDAGQVFSTVSDEQSLYPYIVRLSNLWYVSCLDTQGVLFYILADVLHDFFEEYHDTSSPKIYVRIEDVHAERSIENLYKIADYLQQENVPYMVALIPSFYDFKTKNIFDLKDNKRFADCIKYMQDSGGSIVLHGYTHQIHKDMPGEGFEFWDGEKDQPLPVDMKKWVDERINAAIDECTEVGIGPIAFEAPHYAASSEAYKNLKRYFSTIIGHLQTSDRGYTTTPYPYTLHYSSLYNNLIPENLGYVDPDDLLYKEHIFEELEKVAIVRDYTAGFYFHSYLDPKLLEPIIVEIKKRGIDFLDLKQENNWVKGANYIISSQSGNIQIEKVKTLKEPLLIRIFRRIFIVLLILVTTICLRLLYIFLDRRRKAKEYLFKE